MRSGDCPGSAERLHAPAPLSVLLQKHQSQARIPLLPVPRECHPRSRCSCSSSHPAGTSWPPRRGPCPLSLRREFGQCPGGRGSAPCQPQQQRDTIPNLSRSEGKAKSISQPVLLSRGKAESPEPSQTRPWCCRRHSLIPVSIESLLVYSHGGKSTLAMDRAFRKRPLGPHKPPAPPPVPRTAPISIYNPSSDFKSTRFYPWGKKPQFSVSQRAQHSTNQRHQSLANLHFMESRNGLGWK